jgi:hypothetical protein
MLFYLGTHHPHWLSMAGVPLFVSHRRLTGRRRFPRAGVRWALDSGGFTELSMFGEWRTSPAQYVTAVARYASEIGRLDWAAPQDWMCEPFMLARTGLSVEEHQRRTIDNYLRLHDLWSAPDPCPFIPVLQGWTLPDYWRCVDLYDQAGIDLTALPVVGLGSVCRRQATAEIDHLIRSLAPLRLHGFGCKTAGLASYGHVLTSADSLAWSYAGRRTSPGCTPSHRNEANCLPFALTWRSRVLAHITEPEQLALPLLSLRAAVA